MSKSQRQAKMGSLCVVNERHCLTCGDSPSMQVVWGEAEDAV